MKLYFHLPLVLTGLALSLHAAQLPPEKAKTPGAAKAPTNSPAITSRVLDTSDSYQPHAMDRFIFRIQEDPYKGGEEPVAVSAIGDMQFKISRGVSDIVITLNSTGKTVGQIKKELKAQLDADYYQNATVFLRLHDQSLRPGTAYITGAMKDKIQLLPDDPKTVYTALLQVGWNDFANLKKVKLWRHNPATNKDEAQTIDVKSMLDGGSHEKDVVLQDGDRIEILEKMFIFK